MKRMHVVAVAVFLAAILRSPAGAEAVPAAVKAFVDQGVIAGAVTLVADRNGVLALDAVGQSDLAAKTPMRTNSLFWIASMTKPTTGALILMLQDEKKLSVDDPVARYLPEFKGIRVKDATADATLTIRHLLTHTSGLETVPPAKPDAALAELMASYAAKPLKFEPGSKWEYCNGGINTLGRIVEVVSGKPYAQFLRERLLEPLGMTETTFWPSGDLKSRLATSYTVGADGRLEPTDIFFLKGALDDTTRTAFPSGGLFSTAADYARFLQMLLNGGEWKGRRLLSREAVAQMTRTQTGDLKTGFVDGMSFGFACGVVRTPQGVTAMLSPGTFGHGGSYGTQAWADPAKGRVFVLMIQRAKLPNADASDIRKAFQDAAAKAFPADAGIRKEAVFGTASMSFDGAVLRVATGAIERRWAMTPNGLATVSVADPASGAVYGGAPASPCDWEIPGIGPDAKAELRSLEACEDDDEGFAARHLRIAAEFEYPAAGMRARYVVWAYPGAPGLRTELQLRRTGTGPASFPREPGTGETLPGLPGGRPLLVAGYYADTQHRNTAETEILREEMQAGMCGTNDWASLAVCGDDAGAVILVKESHKCVNTPDGGANTGAFAWDARGLRSTGLGWYPADVGTSRFHRCWAHWTVVGRGGADERALALKRFDRARYPIDPARDLYVMANTWGSGANHFAAREANVRREIDSQADLGIDVQQIDDGWQGIGTFGDDWRPVARVTEGKNRARIEPYDVYPSGWGPVRTHAAAKGVTLGLWANCKIPDDDLLWNCDRGGFGYFKLDFANLKTMAEVRELMDKARRLILHSGHRARVNWDVTEKEPRVGYFFGREYGNIYLANRKPDQPRNVVYMPWLVLRDAWQVASHGNLNKFQISVQNPARTNRDLSDAWKHPHDYCVAQTLMGSPIFFQETQYYDEAARSQIRPLLAVYRNHRAAMFKGYVFPVGDEPDNRSWSGFQNHDPESGAGYLTLFRQIGNGDPKHAVALKFLAGRTIRVTDLVRGTDRTVRAPADGRVEFAIDRAPGFLFLRYEPVTHL